MSDSEFMYQLDVDKRKMPLRCQINYDYSTDCGPSAYLTKAMFFGWNIVGILGVDIREEIEEYYLSNAYAIEQEQTHNSLKRDNEL
jgi:hypothetical protein